MAKQSRQFKAYSQNVCILPAGARERFLPVGGMVGTVTTVLAVLYWSWSLSWWAQILLFSALFGTGVLSPVVVHIAVVVLGPIQAALSLHDFKSERLEELATRLSDTNGSPKYDVVLLQEFYGCWYSDTHRDFFTKRMAQRGYAHVAKPKRTASFPALWANSGLAVFSPFPIDEISQTSFQAQTVYDRFAVNRGVLGCRLRIPGLAQGLYVMTTHFGPSLAVLELASFLPQSVSAFLDVHGPQVDEIAAHIQRQVPKGSPIILTGDFNAIHRTPSYFYLRDVLASFDLQHLTESLFESDSSLRTVNPDGERLLTGGTRAPRILDYAFGLVVSCPMGMHVYYCKASLYLGAGRLVKVVNSELNEQPTTLGNGKVQNLSDHIGVHVEFAIDPDVEP